MTDPTTAWRSLPPGDLAALGQRLGSLGLTERAVSACFAVRCPHHAPLAHRRSRAGASDRAVPGLPPAAVLPHLLVAGASVPRAQAEHRLGPDWPLLQRLGWLTPADDPDRPDDVRATIALLPVADALVVSDRADAGAMSDPARPSPIAPFCDDSSFHTLGMLPRRLDRPARWLDIGTGTGVAVLARPGLTGPGGAILASDIEPRAIAMARLGAALSGVTGPEFTIADLCEAGEPGARNLGPWDLITFNAPLPDPCPGQPAGLPATLIDRFWSRVRGGNPALLAPGGEVIVHSWQPERDYPASLDLPGRVIALRYTPPGVRPAFGVTVWQPAGPAEHRLVPVELIPDRPHLQRSQMGSG